ncbi:AraC family transcriptional regulator [Pragia fontium]|uniref:AraC family transcriptional regulator n=1 Tax=Pragia fontium TaxID=82985 RepID=UPI00064AEC8A|nr:helix-turn-helix transcriptional regulator [Pragia fontium]AKJ43312.1 AraC family transcriptional regulator [Pragia fontium]
MAGAQCVTSTQSYPDSILFFRCENVNSNTEFGPHLHDWGQVICVKSGVFALNIGGQRFLAPSGFAIWIPVGMEHSSYNRKPTRFRSINIDARFCGLMPLEPCVLNMDAVCSAIVESCFERDIMVPQTPADRRLCRVLIDQLSVAPVQHTYLPGSDDKFLAPILQALEANPSDNTSLADWAKRVYTTERTLARRCSQELGMSFGEWRQRLRFLYGISLLEQGKTVQDVALEVGYSSASAFIAMFQHIAGTTPERYRRG